MTNPAIRVLRLTPARAGDYLDFFDHERGRAFADNPDWARCYCNFPRIARELDWKSFDGVANRTAIAAAIESGEAEGYLAFAGGAVVGWINAQPRHKLPHCFDRMGVAPPAIDVAPHDAAVVVCFVIDPAWRRRGVARELLDRALDDLRERGIRIVDAFPFDDASRRTDASHYHGPRSLFEAAGFVALEARDGVTIMRKRLDAR